MISHHLRFASANASLLLNMAICNFQWGPPNVSSKQTARSDSPMSLSFPRSRTGIKSLAKPLASQTHIAQRLLSILWFGSYEMQKSRGMLTTGPGISLLFCPSQRTAMDYASIQNRCGHQGHHCTTGWPLRERMPEMMIVHYSQCFWLEGCRVYQIVETYQRTGC